MEKIKSFTVDHLRLNPGVYVSREDKFNGIVITTFDIRMTKPNSQPVMNTTEIHTVEHLGATYLRNHPEFAEKTVYFGPMGCRTGFYWVAEGNYHSKDVFSVVISMFEFIRDYEGDVPGASPKDCGNYLDLNLALAKERAKQYLDEVLYHAKEENLIYPQ